VDRGGGGVSARLLKKIGTPQNIGAKPLFEEDVGDFEGGIAT